MYKQLMGCSYRDLESMTDIDYTTFIKFAKQYSEKIDVDKRWQEWIEFEGSIIGNYGKSETVHG